MELFLACRNSFRLHIHWKLDRPRLKFLSIFWKRVRERERDCTRLFHHDGREFIGSIRIVFDMEILVEQVTFRLNTGNTCEANEWGKLAFRTWMVRNGWCTRNTYVREIWRKLLGECINFPSLLDTMLRNSPRFSLMRCNHLITRLKMMYAKDRVFGTRVVCMYTSINKNWKTRNKIESGRLDCSVD